MSRLSNKNTLLAFLEQIEAAPTKRLSQNFLIDANIVEKILQQADLKAGDLVLEIGPGPGVLTEAMLEKGAYVVAIEKDRKLAPALERLQTPDQRLVVIEGDALEADIPTLLQKLLTQHGKAKLIANLPYQLTSPLLTRLAPLDHCLSSLTVMVQDEVARRICAKAGGRDYGSLSVFLQVYGIPSYAFTVGRKCFYPAPKVDSAILHLKVEKRWEDLDEAVFFSLTRTAFQQRRKMLRRSLKELMGEKGLSIFSTAGIEASSRPEQLDVEAWYRLYQAFKSHNAAS